MADTVTGKYLYFDSTNEVITQWVNIQLIMWVSSAARRIVDDNDFLLQDGEGTPIFGKRAEQEYHSFVHWYGPEGLTLHGIDIQTLDGGVVWIVLKDEIRT